MVKFQLEAVAVGGGVAGDGGQAGVAFGPDGNTVKGRAVDLYIALVVFLCRGVGQHMELFFRHPRQVFSSEHLMENIWGLDSEAEMDVVWTYISFLRKKLKQVGANIEIRTIRGAGYALEEMSC